jgi:hypothetical protein
MDREISSSPHESTVDERQLSITALTTSFVGRAWPAPWLDDRVEFGEVTSSDAPRRAFDVADQVWDAARVRATEDLTEGADRD